jgi:hypothetical protein
VAVDCLLSAVNEIAKQGVIICRLNVEIFLHIRDGTVSHIFISLRAGSGKEESPPPAVPKKEVEG